MYSICYVPYLICGTYLIFPWCWERLKAGGKGDGRGPDGWIAPPTRWTRVWASKLQEMVKDREAWRAAVHGATESNTTEWLSNTKYRVWGFPCGSCVKNLPANAGDPRNAGWIPGLGRPPGGGHGNPLQYSCLENPMDRGVGELQFTGSQRVRHDWIDLARACVCRRCSPKLCPEPQWPFRCCWCSFVLFKKLYTYSWRRKWQPTPVFLPGESQGLGSLVGCRLWGRTESDTTEVT